MAFFENLAERLRETALFEKPAGYWVLTLALFGYLSMQSKGMTLRASLLNAAISAMLGYALSESVAEWSGVNENLVQAAIMMFGVPLLGIANILFHDREFWRTEGREIIADYLRKRLGVERKK